MSRALSVWGVSVHLWSRGPHPRDPGLFRLRAEPAWIALAALPSEGPAAAAAAVVVLFWQLQQDGGGDGGGKALVVVLQLRWCLWR